MALQQRDINRFKKGETENPEFWARFGTVPDLKGAIVLDVGSGRGSLCIDIALAGGTKVVGLDIKPQLVAFANEYLKQNYSPLTSIVEFKDIDLRYYDDRVLFDYIVSKNAFEHIVEPDRILSEMIKRLKPGGKVFAGFGPLYSTPYGDHNRRRSILRPWGLWGRLLALIPWGHLFMESTIINMNNRHRQRKVTSMFDLGLNKWSVSDYRRAFHESGLAIVEFRVNQSDSIQSKIFSVLRKIPFLEDYCTHNIYCILEKQPIE